jgi:hypothetical protein
MFAAWFSPTAAEMEAAEEKEAAAAAEMEATKLTEEQEAKEAIEGKEPKEAKEAKGAKEAKEAKEARALNEKAAKRKKWRERGLRVTEVAPQRKSAIVETAMLMSALMQWEVRTLAFCRTRKLVELVREVLLLMWGDPLTLVFICRTRIPPPYTTYMPSHRHPISHHFQ